MKNWANKEKKDAKLFNAKQTPRSGGLWFAKADSKSDKFLIENKTSDKENFTIQGLVWDKIEREALMNSRVPILSIEFGKKKRELIIFDKNDFLDLIEMYKSGHY